MNADNQLASAFVRILRTIRHGLGISELGIRDEASLFGTAIPNPQLPIPCAERVLRPIRRYWSSSVGLHLRQRYWNIGQARHARQCQLLGEMARDPVLVADIAQWRPIGFAN